MYGLETIKKMNQEPRKLETWEKFINWMIFVFGIGLAFLGAFALLTWL